jgi:hypothetical protein
LAAARDDLKARGNAAFARPPATPPAAPAEREARAPRAAPPAAALAKAEDEGARSPAGAAPRPEAQVRVAPAAPFAAAPDAASLEGAAGQHLREPEEEKDVAEAVPTDEEPKKHEPGRATSSARLRDQGEVRPKGQATPLAYPSLLAEAPASAEEARRIRGRWRAFLEQSPPARQADEARVRVVEMGVRAWRFSNDPADLALLRQDAESYLRREDAAQGERVRALLATTGN